jgi:hypothetical protein
MFGKTIREMDVFVRAEFLLGSSKIHHSRTLNFTTCTRKTNKRRPLISNCLTKRIMTTSAEKRPRSSGMDSQAAKATKKAKESKKGTLKMSTGRSAVDMNGNGASRKVAANNNGNALRDGKPRQQAHVTNGDDNLGTLESRPPQKLRQDEGKATASATESGGSKAKAPSSTETTSSSTNTKAGCEQASVSSWAWYYTILFWVAALLLLTNVVTLGMWLETKMEYELRTAEMQEQVRELPQVKLRAAELQEQVKELPQAKLLIAELQEKVEELLPHVLQEVASWQEFGRTVERYRNDCADTLKDVMKERGGECVDEETGCPMWAEDGQCFQNPGFMLLSCRQSCDAC